MVAISVSDLAHATPADYGAAADNLQQIADSFERAAADFDRRVVTAVRQAWDGDAATSAIAYLVNLAGQMTATEEYLTRFIGLLRAGQEGITGAQAYLNTGQHGDYFDDSYRYDRTLISIGIPVRVRWRT